MLVAMNRVGVMAQMTLGEDQRPAAQPREASTLAQKEQESDCARCARPRSTRWPWPALSRRRQPPSSPGRPEAIRGKQYTVKSWVWKVTQTGHAEQATCTARRAPTTTLRIPHAVAWVASRGASRTCAGEHRPDARRGRRHAGRLDQGRRHPDAEQPRRDHVYLDGGSSHATTAPTAACSGQRHAGSHTITFTQRRYTTPDGQNNVSKTVSVSDSTTSFANFTTPRAASQRVRRPALYYKTSSGGSPIYAADRRGRAATASTRLR